MELKMNDYLLPEKILFNYEELKQELVEKIAHYETLVYTDEQISEAEKVASDYYKNFAHKVKDLKFKKIKGKKVIFQIYDETNEATRFIYLKLQNGKWKVVNEGY